LTPDQKAFIHRDCSEILDGKYENLQALRGQKILVTGGTGFLGTWITMMVSFLNDFYEFGTRLDLLSTHANTFTKKQPHLADRADVTVIEQDVRYISEIGEDVNWIIHAASSPDSRLHASDPLHTVDVISNGTSSLLTAASRLPNLKKVLNVSSGLVYGSQSRELERITEDSWGFLDPASVSAVYAEAKRYAETLCAAYRNHYRMPIVTARPFAFIGPHQLLDKPWAINNFLRDALTGGPIRILGDEKTVRSYLYASDMAFWLLRILVDGKNGQCFNVGSPHYISLAELAEKIASKIPQGIEVTMPIIRKPSRARSRFVPDVSLAETILGLHQTVGLDDAIGRTLLWNRLNSKS